MDSHTLYTALSSMIGLMCWQWHWPVSLNIWEVVCCYVSILIVTL